MLNVDTAELSLILPREQGGDFAISPDGEKLAIIHADSIAMAAIDGTNLVTDLVTFQSIITYSEYRYYPVPVWAPDSSRFGVFIPSSDPLAEDPNGTVWIIPVEGQPMSSPPISGQAFFPQSNGNSLLSPDMQSVAILRESEDEQTTMLFLSHPDGSNSRLYAEGSIQWIGWNPDGSLFAFRRDNETIILGGSQRDPGPIADGRSLRWVTPELFVAQAGRRGNWSLMLGDINGTASMLLQLSSESLVYDLR
jgi:Tol biopolymer transport system component